jgi:hypothetical protein
MLIVLITCSSVARHFVVYGVNVHPVFIGCCLMILSACRDMASAASQPARPPSASSAAGMAAVWQPQPSAVFPATLPALILTPEQQQEKYGLPKNAVPRQLQDQMNVLERWQMEPINLERSHRYVRAVQSTTTEKHETCILGYLGYVMTKFGVRPDQLSLSAYLQPERFVHFIAYLKARGVQKGQLVKHVSIARKVADYLQSGAAHGSSTRMLVERVDSWLANLEAQIASSMPAPTRATLPEVPAVFRWVDTLVDVALLHVDAEMSSMKSLSGKTAWKVERALLASLVTGRFIPPCRLNLLKTMPHPRYNGPSSCTDPDCMIKPCSGNQIQINERQETDDLVRVCLGCLP